MGRERGGEVVGERETDQHWKAFNVRKKRIINSSSVKSESFNF